MGLVYEALVVNALAGLESTGNLFDSESIANMDGCCVPQGSTSIEISTWA